MHKACTGVALSLMLFFLLTTGLLAQEEQMPGLDALVFMPYVENGEGASAAEVEPDWNLRITPFADHNENGVLDEGEDFVPAAGDLTYVEVGGGRTWEAHDGPALVRVPYGTVFTVQGEAEANYVYECFSPHTYRMVDSGAARVDFACDPRNWFEFAHHVWVSLVTSE